MHPQQLPPTYQIAVFQPHEFFGTHILVHCSIVAHDAFAISGRLSEVSLSPSKVASRKVYLCRALGRSPGQLLNGSCSRGHGCIGVYPLFVSSSILAIERQTAYLSTTRDHRHSRAPKNKNKRFRDAGRKKERGRELLCADPRYAIAHTDCFVLIPSSCFFGDLHTSQRIGTFFSPL